MDHFSARSNTLVSLANVFAVSYKNQQAYRDDDDQDDSKVGHF
jgi:hypothetical protein